MSTNPPACVCHLVTRGGCQQGSKCPIREFECAMDTPLTGEQFPTPKVRKPMNRYRLTSSALTGRAPRSLSQAFGCSMNDPVYPMPDAHSARTFGRRINDAMALAWNFCRDAVGGFFGR